MMSAEAFANQSLLRAGSVDTSRRPRRRNHEARLAAFSGGWVLAAAARRLR